MIGDEGLQSRRTFRPLSASVETRGEREFGFWRLPIGCRERCKTATKC